MASSVHGFAAPLYYGDLGSAAVGEMLSVDGAEARHAASVRRVRVGEQISIGDGRGRVASGPVTSARPDEVTIQVDAVVQVPRQQPELVLIQALAKGDRDELAIQAATEVGVDRIVPWAAARSVSRWTGAKRDSARARWQGIVREAAKQSLRAWVPTVEPLADLSVVAGFARGGGRLVVLDPAGSEPLGEAIGRGEASTVTGIAIVVGPEGGIDRGELDALVDVGARIAVLGDTVLRTSTAGPVALGIAQVVLGNWGRA